jgi:perosamine synthetase
MSTTAPMRLFQPVCSEATEQAALAVLRSGQIASGPRVDEFQAGLAALARRPHLVCTSDVTHALVLALQLIGVGPGDEVLTLAYSCLSSNSAIKLAGAKPVWVDIDPATASMSVDDLRRAITPRCKAVTMYHVAGYPGPAAAIAEVCRQHDLAYIEDCNNALGATLAGTPVGRHGDFAVYSFYPNRQINAIEGGALACPDAKSAARAARLRRFGIDSRTFRDALGEIDPASDIPEVGWPASLNHLNAAVGLAQLPTLSTRLARTREVAARMLRQLHGLPGIQAVAPLEAADPAYWVLLLLAEQRDRLLAALKRRRIDCSKLHLRNDQYGGFGATRRDLPGTDRFMAQVLGLPCGWWLSDEQADTIVAAVRSESRA